MRTASGATVTGARAAGAIAGGPPRVRAQGGEGAEGAAAADGADLAAGLLSGVDGGLVEGLRQATAEVLKVRWEWDLSIICLSR